MGDSGPKSHRIQSFWAVLSFRVMEGLLHLGNWGALRSLRRLGEFLGSLGIFGGSVGGGLGSVRRLRGSLRSPCLGLPFVGPPSGFP